MDYIYNGYNFFKVVKERVYSNLLKLYTLYTHNVQYKMANDTT